MYLLLAFHTHLHDLFSFPRYLKILKHFKEHLNTFLLDFQIVHILVFHFTTYTAGPLLFHFCFLTVSLWTQIKKKSVLSITVLIFAVNIKLKNPNTTCRYQYSIPRDFYHFMHQCLKRSGKNGLKQTGIFYTAKRALDTWSIGVM